MKILLVITRLDAGGSADLTLRLAAGLSRYGREVYLLTGPSPEATVDLQRYAAANHFRLRIIKSLRRELNPLADLLALLCIWWEITRFRPEVLHTNTSKAGFVGRLAGRLAHVNRIVHSDHGHIFYGYYTPALTFGFVVLEKLASRWCHLILTLTESGKRDYLNLKIGKPQQFVVSYGGADLKPFFAVKARPPALPTKAQPLRICWVGRIVPIKNLPLLLRAAAILQAQDFPAEYWIIGDGSERAACERLARRLELRQVTFLGFRRDIAHWLAQSDLFVFTSLNEGFGLVIIEAMACGLPVIGPAVGGTPDLITPDENGILVPSNDAPALAKAIERLAGRPDLRLQMRQANQKKAVKYSIDNYIHRVMQCYQPIEREYARQEVI